VSTFAAQMIATTIASEKENKTLETLLSLPVKRQHIVATKMLAAGIVAAGASLLYLFGMHNYISGFTGGTTAVNGVDAAAASLGLTLHPAQYALLGLSLFLAILIALAIALILGAFAEDVRGAQGLVAPMTVLILIPYLLTFFLNLQSLSPVARTAIYAIPFSHPFLAAPSLMLGNYHQVWYGIIYQLLWFLALLWVATRIFTTDRIVTLKLSFGKKRRLGNA
jgi:ABC-2 type transport system permease protein